MNCEAKRVVPPCSLAEQRRIHVFPQFSTIACAGPWSYVVLTWAVERRPVSERLQVLHHRVHCDSVLNRQPSLLPGSGGGQGKFCPKLSE